MKERTFGLSLPWPDLALFQDCGWFQDCFTTIRHCHNKINTVTRIFSRMKYFGNSALKNGRHTMKYLYTQCFSIIIEVYFGSWWVRIPHGTRCFVLHLLTSFTLLTSFACCHVKVGVLNLVNLFIFFRFLIFFNVIAVSLKAHFN